MSFSVSWDRTAAFLDNVIQGREALSLQSKIAITLILIGKELGEEKAHEFNNYFLNVVSTNRAEFLTALNSLRKCPITDIDFWRSLDENLPTEFTLEDIRTGIAKKRLKERYQKFIRNTVDKRLQVHGASSVELAVRQLNETGYCIIHGVYSDSEILLARERALEHAKDEITREVAYQYGSGGHLQRVYGLALKDEIFLNLLINQISIGIADQFFERDTIHETYLLSSYQANILSAGAESQQWHVDTALPSPLPQWPVRLNYNILLDDFTSMNGSTKLVPGSHHLNTNIAEREVFSAIAEKSALQIEASKGSVICWDGRLWHKSDSNKSDKSRAALLACFSSSVLAELAAEEQLANYFHNLEKHFSWHEALLLGLSRGRKEGTVSDGSLASITRGKGH